MPGRNQQQRRPFVGDPGERLPARPASSVPDDIDGRANPSDVRYATGLAGRFRLRANTRRYGAQHKRRPGISTVAYPLVIASAADPVQQALRQA